MNEYFVDLSDPSRGPGTGPSAPHGTEPAGTSPRVRRPVGTTPASLATVSLLLAGFWGTWLALTVRLLLDGSRQAGGPAILSAGLMVLAYLGLGAALLAARQERPGDRARYLRRATSLVAQSLLGTGHAPRLLRFVGFPVPDDDGELPTERVAWSEGTRQLLSAGLAATSLALVAAVATGLLPSTLLPAVVPAAALAVAAAVEHGRAVHEPDPAIAHHERHVCEASLRAALVLFALVAAATPVVLGLEWLRRALLGG